MTPHSALILQPNAEGTIRVYHRSTAPIDVILQEGLKTREQLVTEGKLLQNNGHQACLPDRNNHIYFRAVLQKDAWITALRGDTWIAIDVDPSSIVYDSELRAANKQSYYSSKITLREYMARGAATGITSGAEILITQPVLLPAIFSDNSQNYWLRKEREAKEIQVTHPPLSSNVSSMSSSYTTAPFITNSSSQRLLNEDSRQDRQPQGKHCCIII